MKSEVCCEKSGWLKRFVTVNPFFVASALMILVGIALVLNDETSFPTTNESSLVFSMISVELYQACLVLAAVFLAKRLVHTDSLLLVVIEFVFLVIPFILLTAACQSGSSLDQEAAVKTAIRVTSTTALIVLGLLMMRIGFLMRSFPGLHLRSQVLVFGGILLIFNLVMPLVFFFPFDQESSFASEGRYELFRNVMLTVLPFLAGCANWLPRPTKQASKADEAPSWLEPAGIGILIVMSLFHMVWLWFTYASDTPLTVTVFLPVCWVCAWTAWNRCGDFVEKALASWRYALHFVPFIVVIFLAFDATREVALWLSGANAILYGYMAITGRYTITAKRLALLSFVGILLSRVRGLDPTVPVTTALYTTPNMVLWLLAAALIFIPTPFCGVIGAAALAALAHHVQGVSSTNILPAYATFFGALFVHSCVWRIKDEDLHHSIRILLSGLVCLGTLLSAGASWRIFAYQLGIVVVLIVLSAWLYLARDGVEYFVPIVTMGFGLLALPGRGVYFLASQHAFGPLAVLSAFTLFATGVIVALRKKPLSRESVERAK